MHETSPRQARTHARTHARTQASVICTGKAVASRLVKWSLRLPNRLYSGAAPMAYRNCVFNGSFFAGCYLIRENMFREPQNAAESFAVVC